MNCGETIKKPERVNITCVICPKGCNISVDPATGDVSGNGCPRGKTYALDEVHDPKRIVTTTVRTNSAYPEAMLAVRSNKPVPRKMLFEIIAETNRICVELPVQMGQTILADVCGSGSDIIASRSMDE
ncbi:MAG: DUF1667 domain-containing protein [Planctomycetia bacterium]|nr:DUF1667 domain-containing protein [Planctomycetia bacterium]